MADPEPRLPGFSLSFAASAALLGILGLGSGVGAKLYAAGAVEGEHAQRIGAIEKRLEAVEIVAARVPVHEAAIGEIKERLVRIETKLDRALEGKK